MAKAGKGNSSAPRRKPREYLSLAGEFAVASELCRRGLYAQLTLGLRKRTDLLVEADAGGMLKIQVKAKQSTSWPNCKGISGGDIALALVDFEGKRDNERPDFYVLDSQDWQDLAHRLIAVEVSKGRQVTLNPDGVPLWAQRRQGGRVYQDVSFRAEHVQEFKERWEKLSGMTAAPGTKFPTQP